MRKRLLLFALACLATPARAWDHHASLMPWILGQNGGPAPFTDKTHQALMERHAPVCGAQDLQKLREAIDKFQLNAQTHRPFLASSLSACDAKVRLSGFEMLMAGFVDEPDNGMDRNLPLLAELDPHGDRRWAGGFTGPSSQGFRHLYFISKLQVPPRNLGYAPERVQLFATEAKRRFQAGDPLWGFRLLAWAMHYLQDIGQPYHVVQIPSFRMVPWGELIHPTNLVKEATRIIGNYHYAYEGLALAALQGNGETSSFGHCLQQAEENQRGFVSTVDPTRSDYPRELALEAAQASLSLGRRVGAASVEFFGKEYKSPAKDLPNGVGTPDYETLLRAIKSEPQGEVAREFFSSTCQALSNTIVSSRRLIRWALEN